MRAQSAHRHGADDRNEIALPRRCDAAITHTSMELCSAPFNASALRADPFGASGNYRACAPLKLGSCVMAGTAAPGAWRATGELVSA